MKRSFVIPAVLAIITMFLVSPVAAATSQGLEWGVATGDRFDYTMTSTEEDVPSEDIYINITATSSDAIPDPLADWTNIPEHDLGFWWANGTSMGLSTIIFLGVYFVGGKFALPTGNWTLIQDLLETEISDEDYISDANLWGVEWSQTENATHEFRITATYSKSDGFLAEYKLETWDTSEDTIVSSIEVTREGLPAGGGGLDDIIQLLEDNILYVGIGIAVLVVLGIACKRR
ncbi:MAG: hypothetical protein GF309_03450 [Candidatus Lokiarchaeota archaeon]|nr:hypothetical protein [Candidatus Lokiarchaeota archaeon]